MQASQTVSAGTMPVPSARMNSRVVTAIAIVAAAHVAALAVLMTLRHDPVQPTLESHVMTAQLLPPAPQAAPVAMQSIAPPPPTPTPPVHTKPKVQPKPTPKPKPTPTPLPVAQAPSPTPAAAPDPTPPAPAAPPVPAAPPAQQAAPAISRETMQITAPKNVSHLDCNIAKPDYPALSRRRGETGTAYVKFVVGLTGKLESIELKKSSGFGRLDDAALAAVQASVCKPYLENGQPIRVTYTQPYDFNLND